MPRHIYIAQTGVCRTASVLVLEWHACKSTCALPQLCFPCRLATSQQQFAWQYNQCHVSLVIIFIMYNMLSLPIWVAYQHLNWCYRWWISQWIFQCWRKDIYKQHFCCILRQIGSLQELCPNVTGRNDACTRTKALLMCLWLGVFIQLLQDLYCSSGFFLSRRSQ